MKTIAFSKIFYFFNKIFNFISFLLPVSLNIIYT